VTVTNVNDDPVARDDSATVAEDSSNNAINVLANDDDGVDEGETLTVTAATQGAHGTTTFTATGVSYTPAANYFGPDSFTYTISDGNGGTATATVNMTVTNVNDDPVARDDSATVAEDSTNNAINVLANDDDGVDEGETLTVTAASDPAHGTTTFTATGVSYTPDANYFGPDSFTYTISDGHGASATATVNVTVIPVNDAPVAADDAYATSQATTLNVPAPGVLANDSDVEGSGLTATLVTGPTHGFAFSLNPDGSFTYTPQASFIGTETFTYRACEVAGTGNPPATAPVMCSNIATVRITVTPGTTGPGATGGLTTYTQGGWGAKPSGNNPGALLAARFTGVYGATGVKIGNQGSPYSLTFTAAANVENFLPGGGTASKLTASAVNPLNSSAGVFAGQVLALQISYDFSNAGVTTFGLATKCVTSGPLAGKTVQYVLDLANKVIGGNTALLAANGLSSISVVNDIITRINENYDGGKINKGYLGACQ
jgi:hypothetical protein